MPLLTKMLPLRETSEDLQAASLHSSQDKNSAREEKDQDSGYEDCREYNDDDDDECLDSDMEGSIVHRGRPKKVVRAPAIPARNERRASKILENVLLELKTLDGSASKDTDSRSRVQESDPHESYLSSEEDASLSDDYEDTDSLFDTESPSSNEADAETSSEKSKSPSGHSRRKSQEDTARVVSFISVGKPQIVDIFIHSNHSSPVEGSNVPQRHSVTLDALTSSEPKPTRRPAPLRYPSYNRRMSISSITSSHTSNSSYTTTSNLTSLPPRKSSRLALNINSLVSSTRNTLQTSFSASSATPPPSFLSSDPYSESRQETEPDTPKTPTSIAIAAWKRGLGKTLNNARRPSMPKLSAAYQNASVSNLLNNNKEQQQNRRISMSAANFEPSALARLASESSRESSTVVSPTSPQSSTGNNTTSLERPKTMQTPLTSPVSSYVPSSTSYIPPSNKAPVRYDGATRVPPPIPSSEPTSAGGNGRRSFSLAAVGLGRKKSTKGGR